MQTDISSNIQRWKFKTKKGKQEAVQRHCACDVSPDQSLENMTPLWRKENMTPTPQVETGDVDPQPVYHLTHAVSNHQSRNSHTEGRALKNCLC